MARERAERARARAFMVGLGVGMGFGEEGGVENEWGWGVVGWLARWLFVLVVLSVWSFIWWGEWFFI